MYLATAERVAVVSPDRPRCQSILEFRPCASQPPSQHLDGGGAPLDEVGQPPLPDAHQGLVELGGVHVALHGEESTEMLSLWLHLCSSLGSCVPTGYAAAA